MSPAEQEKRRAALEESIRGVGAMLRASLETRIAAAQSRGDVRELERLQRGLAQATASATRYFASQLALLGGRPLVLEEGSPLFEAAKRASAAQAQRVAFGHPAQWPEPRGEAAQDAFEHGLAEEPEE